MLIREEEQKQKQVQSVIKGWLTDLENIPGWEGIDSNITSNVRLAIIRTAWSSYKIGLFSKEGELVSSKDS